MLEPEFQCVLILLNLDLYPAHTHVPYQLSYILDITKINSVCPARLGNPPLPAITQS